MSGSEADRFRRVDAVFDAALDQEDAVRGEYVARACGGDAELQAAVLELLEAHRRSAGFLEAAAARVVAPLLEEAGLFTEASAQPPPRVGSFRVVCTLGHGGMGAVYLGERDDGQFTQRVALKLIRHEAAGDDLVRRFLEERRILALLEHPGIARLIDGGIAADGRPYFAMEYVEGEPLDRYCDARSLTIEARLQLFGAVCDAVDYAHRHLVVHRDLKPSNVMVTADGQLKLLDFGIAKLLAARGSLDDQLTRPGLYPMTPQFASPEQVRGDPVSTATDVYALGVLLHSLLTGQAPYDLRGKTPAEIERTVCELQPPPPSAAFAPAQPEPERSARAKARGGSPERLRRRLRGDLDLIVGKALRKEPARRYHSAAALREDLERFRRGLPVLARPDSVAYRARRFAGRHPAGLAAAAAVVLGLGGAALRERALRGRAERETAKARAVQDYMVSVFDVSDPFATSGLPAAELTARALLDRGAARIDTTLAGQPEVQAELRGVLGRVYANLGLYDQALPHLEQSLAQVRATRGGRDASVAEATDRLGNTLLQLRKLDDAERLLRESLAVRTRLFGERAAATAESQDHLATLLQERSRYDEAEPLFRQALATRRELLGSQDPLVASSLGNLGVLLWLEGKYDAAEPLQREALAIQERRLGARHPLTVQTLGNLAQVQQLRGHIDEAEALFRRALAAKRAILGDAHPSVTIGLNNLAWLLSQEKNQLEEAEALTREALALDRRIFGEQHAYVASSMSNLAVILGARGDLAEAERLHRQVLAMRRALFGEEHSTIARTLSLIAGVRHVQGDLTGALAGYRESTDMYRRVVGQEHPNYFIASVGLARVLADLGRHSEAAPLLDTAIARLDAGKPPQLTALLSARVGLGQVMAAGGRLREALPVLEDAERRTRERFGENSWRTAEARLALGSALAAAGFGERAAPLLRRADQVLLAQRAAQPRLASLADEALRAGSPAAASPPTRTAARS